MTQYDDAVEYQKYKLEAEEWAAKVKSLHAHSLDSMWYGESRSDGSVTDIEYNDGRVERTINSTGKVVMLNEKNVIAGEELVRIFLRGGK
jgi:hypothetical protein